MRISESLIRSPTQTVIIELIPPKSFVSKTSKALDLLNCYGVQVLAIREMVPNQLNMTPTEEYVLKEKDILILL